MGTVSIRSKRGTWLASFCLVTVLLAPSIASAGSVYSFTNITGNSSTDGSNFTMEVLGEGDANIGLYSGLTVGAGQVAFLFKNPAPVGSITEVYFQDGTLLGIADIYTSTGVAFTQVAGANNFPGGETLDPPFKTTAGFSADADAPPAHNGVNQSTEWLAVVFDLINGQDVDDVNAALAVGASNPSSAWDADGNPISGGATGLRIGLHVQALGEESDSFVNNGNPVPEPSSVALALSGLVGFGIAGLRRLRRGKA